MKTLRDVEGGTVRRCCEDQRRGRNQKKDYGHGNYKGC